MRAIICELIASYSALDMIIVEDYLPLLIEITILRAGAFSARAIASVTFSDNRCELALIRQVHCNLHIAPARHGEEVVVVDTRGDSGARHEIHAVEDNAPKPTLSCHPSCAFSAFGVAAREMMLGLPVLLPDSSF